MIGAVCGVAGKTGVGLIQIVGGQVQAVLLLQVLLPLKLLLFLHRKSASSPSTYEKEKGKKSLRFSAIMTGAILRRQP